MQLKHKKTFFCCEGCWTLEEVAQEGCGIYGDPCGGIQNPTGHNLSNLLWLTLHEQRIEPDELQRYLPNSAIMWFCNYCKMREEKQKHLLYFILQKKTGAVTARVTFTSLWWANTYAWNHCILISKLSTIAIVSAGYFHLLLKWGFTADAYVEVS